MPLISIAIVCGVKTIRPFGIVVCDESAGLLTVYESICDGTLSSGDESFFLAPEHAKSSVIAMVGTSANGFFQAVPLTEKVGDCLEFGKYFKFVLKSMNMEKIVVQNAFELMIQSANKKCLPQPRATSRNNSKFELYNAIINFLKEGDLGWKIESLHLGEHFVGVLCDALWLLDPHRRKLNEQQCAIPSMFDIFTNLNDPRKHKHLPRQISRDELLTISQQLFDILEQPWLKKVEWREMCLCVESLTVAMNKYAEYLKKKLEECTSNQSFLKPVRSTEDCTSMMVLPSEKAQVPLIARKFQTMTVKLENVDNFDPVFVNDYLPLDRKVRYDHMTLLKLHGLSFPTVLYTHTSGGNVVNFHFIWKVPESSVHSCDEILSKSVAVSQSLQSQLPQYHTRQMRREFVSMFGKIAKVKPCYLREMYRKLTGDCSSANDGTTAAVDKRVQQLIELGDPDIVVDLRDHNPGRPSKYEPFWIEVEKYMENVVQTAVQERRHGTVTYLATAMSVRHLIESVKKQCPPDILIPSPQWLRLQFWPKNPTSRASLQYTGRLKIKYMIQQRQLRKEHQDTHYASALFRYQKEMAVMFREHSVLLSVDDKHKIKVGEPGHPVAAVERGKKVVIGLNQSFEVSDHDFTKITLTPSVILQVDIPESIEGSFYRGKVHTALKDSVFQPSSPLRHATEITQVLEYSEKPMKEVLLLYSDGGPDHRVNYLSVQLSLIALFLKCDFDGVIAVRTPPGHSWKNPCERIMSILNLALQAVGVMRQKMSPETEALLAKCNSVTDVRTAAMKVPALKDSLPDSLQDTICLISSLFRELKLKDIPFSSFSPATNDEMNALHDLLNLIDEDVPQNATMKYLKKSDALMNFFDKHCQVRHYSFSVLKCSDPGCQFHKVPRLPEAVFQKIHHLPDPILAADGLHFKPFPDVYGRPTTEQDRPSLNIEGKKIGHGLPFNPSAQTSGRVKRTVVCQECDKPRVLHAARKLKPKQLDDLDTALSEVDYTCGTDLADFVPDDYESEAEHILKTVFVRKDLECNLPIEVAYYSSGVFSAVCCHCASGEGLLSGPQAQDNYPICHTCSAIPSKPAILKRKRKRQNKNQ